MSNNISAFPPREETFVFGNVTVVARECPLPRVRRFQKLWGTFFEEVQKIQAEAALAASEDPGSMSLAAQFESLSGLLLDQPYEILSILIPDLPKEPFEDEEGGVTIPQLFDAFDKVLELNRIGWLKKLTPFFQNMILSIDQSSLQSALV